MKTYVKPFSFIRKETNGSLNKEREMIPYCKAHGIGLIPWSPLHQGDLARPLTASTARKEESKGTFLEHRLSAADKTIISRVEELAKKKGWNMSDISLAWIQTKVTSPIVGVNSVGLSGLMLHIRLTNHRCRLSALRHLCFTTRC